MNSTTGDFSELRKSIPNDEIYKRGAHSSVKRKPLKLLNLRPLNLNGIKKEIEEECMKEIPSIIKTNVNENNENQEVTIEGQDSDNEPQQIPSDNRSKCIPDYSDQFITSHKDKEKSFIEKTDEVSCLSTNTGTNYLSRINENKHIPQGQKNDSFDLDFSALSLSTPIKQVDGKENLSSNIIMPEHVRDNFQQFVTPQINKQVNSSLLRNHFSLSKQTPLKTTTNSFNRYSARKLIPYKPTFLYQVVPENQPKSDDDKGSNTFPNYSKDKITTPLRNVPVTIIKNSSTRQSEDDQCPVSLTTMRDDTFKKIKVNDTEYIIFSLLGKGGSSEVYQCYNLECKLLVAIKCVSLHNSVSVSSYINEVKLLQQLQGCDKIIKMFDYEISESQKKLFVVLESGGNDVSTILKQLALKKSHIPMYMLLFYWMEMLHAVKQIHSHGIIHSDLKPSNFLKVGEGLKLIDFGIAASVQTDMTSVIKTKQEGSCNYLSPEALNSEPSTNFNNKNMNAEKYRIHFKSDVWSLGCILYQFVYRRTPFQHITQLWPKLAAIMNPDHKIDYPDAEWVSPKVIVTIKKCLQYNVKSRPSIDELISEYDTILHNI